MIVSFKHKALRKFYEAGNTAGIQHNHENRLRFILARLDAIHQPEDMNLPGFNFHTLKGQRKNEFSVSVNKNWRIIFKFDGKNVYDVNYEDYH